VKLRFWGVRGSIPVPGPQTSRYGGNTSCIEVSNDEHVLVLDCGTGARELGHQLLMEGPRRGLDIFFTHLHVDHVFGFPFFGPIFAPSRRINVSVPAHSPDECRDLLARFLNGVNHPLRLHLIPAELRFGNTRPGKKRESGPFLVTPIRLNHPGGSLGYRVTDGKHTVLYLTDTAPLAKVGEGIASGIRPPDHERTVLAEMEGADVVVMDTMFSWEEYLEKMTWGHAYPEYGVALAKAAQVKHLVLFHHAPTSSDEDLDMLARKWDGHTEPTVTLAREGVVIDLEG